MRTGGGAWGLGKEMGGGRRVLRRFGAEEKSEKEPPVRGKRHSARVFSQSASGDRFENSWIGDRRKLGLHFSPFNVFSFIYYLLHYYKVSYKNNYYIYINIFFICNILNDVKQKVMNLELV